MKLLLDECTPKRLRLEFPGHEVITVEEAGFAGLKNGELLSSASERFDALITVDQNMPFQQNVATYSIAIVILIARPNRYPELRRLVPKVLAALDEIKAGQVIRIG
ncbi:MAG: hypothetical protein DMF69_06675 [Acidobacteria bacterium]|nr:MAG: hypothetical protein DMF69_06675 [Acidobacteriota bacterium]